MVLHFIKTHTPKVIIDFSTPPTVCNIILWVYLKPKVFIN